MKILRTASLGANFTGSYKTKECKWLWFQIPLQSLNKTVFCTSSAKWLRITQLLQKQFKAALGLDEYLLRASLYIILTVFGFSSFCHVI